MTVSGSGHRPDKLGGYGDDVFRALIALAKNELLQRRPAQLITGMALGWDQALAQAALECDIPFIAAVPFPGQERRWPQSAIDRYHVLLAHATHVHVIGTRFSREAMQARNVWMVDRSHMVLALWNGSPGGTANCLEYARSRHKPVANLWPVWTGQPVGLDQFFV